MFRGMSLRVGLLLFLIALVVGLIWFFPWKNHKIASLNAVANDVTADPETRCHAIFRLFEDFVKPGCTLAELRMVLADTRWLQKTNLQTITALGGAIPVEFGPGPVFIASGPLVGTKRHARYYDVYFRLSEDAPDSVDGCLAMLKNNGEHDKVQLVEFALCYPEGYNDVFTVNGKKSDKPTPWQRAQGWIYKVFHHKR